MQTDRKANKETDKQTNKQPKRARQHHACIFLVTEKCATEDRASTHDRPFKTPDMNLTHTLHRRYCGVSCYACKEIRCKNDFHVSKDSRREICKLCAFPHCAKCGTKYLKPVAFSAAPERKWFCSNAACETARRNHAGR